MSLNAEVVYGSERHQRVLDGLLARVQMSTNDMQRYWSNWDKAEKLFVAEIPEREVDTLRRAARDGGKPQYTTINVPYSYGVMMTAHTYLSSVFLGRNPILEWQATSGASAMNTEAVSALMDYQTRVGGHILQYYIRNHDALKYGVSILGTYWCDEKNVVADSRVEIDERGQPAKVKSTKTFQGYKGNKLFAIRPKDFIPDTRVPLIQMQEGEFAGRHTELTWNTIVQRKLTGQYINVDIARDTIRSGAVRMRDASGTSKLDLPGNDTPAVTHTDTSLIGVIPTIELVVELIPREWELGSSEAPEKWIFTIIDRKVIVEARPLGLWHNKFPFNVTETEIEGYSLVKRGFMEIAQPMNDIMTWLFNSHFYAVRKSINGDVVYDPTKVYASDLLNSDGTGSRIRLRPEAYGTDVRTVITQLAGGADITGRHLVDTEIVGNMINTMLGVADAMSGQGSPSGRKTATQIRTETSGSINRMKTIAEFMSATGYAPLASMMLQTSQQMYNGDEKLRIVGDTVNLIDPFVQVNPDTISGEFEFVPVDGTLPLDRFGMVNMWTQLLAQVRNFPQVAQQYDLGGIFSWVAQLAGLKNIKQFKIQLVPDQMMGNMPGGIPLGQPGIGGGPPAGSPTRTVASGGGPSGPPIPLPRQIPGMGRAG